jgi:chaperone required for assembly of F1-ATPase
VNVTVAARDAAFAILVEGKPALTPKKNPLLLPTWALADVVASEWRERKRKPDLKAMPFTRFANTALDVGDRTQLVGQLLQYGSTDLLLYRGEDPGLAQRQQNEWEPLLRWARDRFRVTFVASTGIMHVEQPRETLEGLRAVLVDLHSFTLTGLLSAATIMASLILALAIAEGQLTTQDAFALSQLDERYQAERWGFDRAAESRAEAMAGDLELAARFLALCRT